MGAKAELDCETRKSASRTIEAAGCPGPGADVAGSAASARGDGLIVGTKDGPEEGAGAAALCRGGGDTAFTGLPLSTA